MSSQLTTTPELSVVVITTDNFDTIRQLVRYLAAQTIKERIELVFVCPSAQELHLDAAETTGFAGCRVAEIGAFDTLHAPRVAGVHNATAPIVAYTEDHYFPEPTWAEALLDAHEDSWAAVGPVIGLANPRHYRAWASYFMQYGPWVHGGGGAGGESHDVPGHNSGYKRSVLLDYGDELDSIMVFESVLHEDLRAKGYQLYVEPRARRWSFARRRLYSFGSPLIPLVRLYRILGIIRRHGWEKDLLPGILPSLTVGLIASALGELLGYTVGVGRAAEETLDLDFRRDRYVMQNDRDELWQEELVQFSPEPPRPGQSATV